MGHTWGEMAPQETLDRQRAHRERIHRCYDAGYERVCLVTTDDLYACPTCGALVALDHWERHLGWHNYYTPFPQGPIGVGR